MNIQNYEYLRDQLFYTGFGNHLEGALKDKIVKGKQEFQLQFKTEIESDPVKAELHFSKSKQSDLYFFNSFRLEVMPKGMPDPLVQKFYINGKDRFTLKESYNLLMGRSVHKQFSNAQGEPYQAWHQLDLKAMDMHGNHKIAQFHANYGYDLQAHLEKLPIMELGDPESQKRLMDSLKRGNRQSVTFQLREGEQRLFIEAVPRFKAVCIYNEQGIRQEFTDDRPCQRTGAKVQEQMRQVQLKTRELDANRSKSKRL